ncbi:MAG: ABC transporter permease [Flavobacteriales bacterium]|nr:ABC transporter permease [Flavobacteriales bacterium]
MAQRTIITPENNDANYWRDLWNYRGLFYFLAWRDILVRYKQTFIGVAWSVLRPALTIAVFWFVGWMFNIPDEGVPRILLVTAATLPWQFFSAAFSESANSLISNSNLLTKVYFPRMIVPASTIIVCLIDFAITFGILVLVMIALQFSPGWQIALLPLFLLLAIVTAMGSGLLIAALNVKYRDFRYLIPFIVQFGLYISPVAFSSNSIYNSEKLPEWIKFVYSLNPMVGVIDGFRWCITGGQIVLNERAFFISVVISILLLITGIKVFRNTEKTFADII